MEKTEQLPLLPLCLSQRAPGVRNLKCQVQAGTAQTQPSWGRDKPLPASASFTVVSLVLAQEDSEKTIIWWKKGREVAVRHLYRPGSHEAPPTDSVGRQLQRSGEVRERQWTVLKVYSMRLKEGNWIFGLDMRPCKGVEICFLWV